MNSEIKLIKSFNQNNQLNITNETAKPIYLFVLCPPFNGSTVLYKILDSSPNISTFLGKTFNNKNKNIIPKGEGHALLIKNRPEYWKHRHDKDYLPDFDEMKRRYDEHWELDKPILCDKSPPFVHYAKELQTYFEQFGTVYFVAMIRSPYSCKWIGTSTWDRFATEQLKNIKTLNNVLYFRYEDLVTDPEKIKIKILEFIPELIEINTKAHLIKGLHPQEPRNQELTTEYRDRITQQKEKNEYLKNIPEEMDFFGYPLVHLEL